MGANTPTQSHRGFFTESLINDGNNASKTEPLHNTIYVPKPTLSGNAVFSSPTLSEAEKTSTANSYHPLPSSRGSHSTMTASTTGGGDGEGGYSTNYTAASNYNQIASSESAFHFSVYQ
ncbi:hypothetical protein BDF20DRAFT_290617 [Mycotypha africana]|uniref:uncharacterized protein n=1 Tax=Mycotypha africana TaxID=64632 RepID=UPI002300824C|nr:uncharacterized protein BDF20DRAFT_290617 [Mycotypha africana]KAI8987809.1 hypothetical protein BDF20DRAFT_290617 [Mycotypha africana]